MVRKRSSRFDHQFAGPLLITALAHTLGVVVLLATPAGLLWRLYARVHSPDPIDADFVMRLLGGLLAGLLAGGVLLAVAALLRYSNALLRALHRIEEVQVQTPAGDVDPYAASRKEDRGNGVLPSDAAAGAAGRRTTLAEVLATLRELRDLTVLSDDERDQVRERLIGLQRQRLCTHINEALDDRRLRAAREHLADGVARFGPLQDLEAMRQKITGVAERTEPLAYARAVRRIEEAVSAGAWLTAEQIARVLAAEYPSAQRCRQLLEATRRGRHYALVQHLTTEHRWSEAVAAAEEFLDVYSDSLEAHTLQVEIQTLRGNAEIQRRKQYEVQIKEHLRAQRFADALRLARHVIETFPQSPQANVLRKQIPALERRITAP
ncbi:MAG: hypothetical protein ACYSVY_19200 [Planctomycetota bacterium]|jgi:hypothetical protein